MLQWFCSNFLENSYIPLTFEHQEREHLSKLCHTYRNKWTIDYHVNALFVRAYEPSVQAHYIRFRWLEPEPKPVFIKLLRCTKAFALIDARDGLSGYVLEKYVSSEDEYPRHMTLFHIDTKFYYTGEILNNSDEKTPHINKNEETRVQPTMSRRRVIDKGKAIATD